MGVVLIDFSRSHSSYRPYICICDYFLFVSIKLGIITFKFMVDCKINPMLFGKKDQLPLKWCLPQTHLLGDDLLSSITYSERIKIETLCELDLSNIQMSDRLKRSTATISYELARCEP